VRLFEPPGMTDRGRGRHCSFGVVIESCAFESSLGGYPYVKRPGRRYEELRSRVAEVRTETVCG
jgi:hypothetical protein